MEILRSGSLLGVKYGRMRTNFPAHNPTGYSRTRRLREKDLNGHNLFPIYLFDMSVRRASSGTEEISGKNET